MRIFINTPAWNIGRNTDMHLQRKMTCLEDSFPDIELYFPHNKILSLWYNVMKVMVFILRHLGLMKQDDGSEHGWRLNIRHLYNERELKSADCDIIYTNSVLPVERYSKPVLIELFYFPPEDVEEHFTEEAQQRFATLTEQIKTLATIPGIYNVRSDYAVGLIEKLCPEQAWKFRNLFFLLPELKAADEKDVICKHEDDECIRFLFCGAQAVRKGLPLVVEAFTRLKSEDNRKCELHIISGMTDGVVNIPNDNSIICHGALPYDEAQTLFAKCHVYVMPSKYETFGISYVEAMAKGMIVIARNYEPQREIIDYGKCGILTMLNPEDVYKSMRQAIAMNREERTDMALKARKRFMDKYSYDKASNDWHKAIKDCYETLPNLPFKGRR